MADSISKSVARVSLPFGSAAAQPSSLRQATASDIPDIQRVRHSVKENRLTSRVISNDEVAATLDGTGRGWVIETGGRITAFAIGICDVTTVESGNVWALFVDPDFEGLGHGRRLHDTLVEWFASRGMRRLWLSTESGTRAERFYEMSGWQRCGLTPDGEVRFERPISQLRASN